MSHAPNCQCSPGHSGDPFTLCSVYSKSQLDFSSQKFYWKYFFNFCLNCAAAPPPAEKLSPCIPSPCGANALCREQNGAGSCTCLDDYVGNPYEGCRPECVLSTDCPANKACIRSKCVDPCPGTCGPNAECQVVNHLPSCVCRTGYTGDPFRYCNVLPPERKRLSFSNRVFYSLNKIKKTKIKFQLFKQNLKILVFHHHVDPTVNVAKSTAKLYALAYQTILEHLLVVDLNVQSVLNAL